MLTNTSVVGLALSSKDESHLQKFSQSISSTYPIKRYIGSSGNPYSRLQITSLKMKNSLIKHGCLENKTLVLTFPAIREDLVFHFIRGYFDGDGSICRSGRSYKFRMCGTKEFLSSVLNILNLKSKLRQRHPSRLVNNWDIDIGGNYQVLGILNKIYLNSTIFLERKYERYIDLQSLLSVKAK